MHRSVNRVLSPCFQPVLHYWYFITVRPTLLSQNRGNRMLVSLRAFPLLYSLLSYLTALKVILPSVKLYFFLRPSLAILAQADWVVEIDCLTIT
ncbi:uncharacterized protein BDW70DRAFT_143896 [Aspergillus foveolatus]|uniref:uncharacterized protein n=1 Tax=Aspergillus foveolatus TaxID=210207 RepID=UPI003CCE4597